MLIIFDLDDTLIDTSGGITPFKISLCLQKMIEMGLEVGDVDRAYVELLQANEELSKTQEAVESYALRLGATESQIHLTLKELATPLPSQFSVPTTPFAKEILEFYRDRYPLILVTAGQSAFQRDKLEKAGIDSSIFSMIEVPEDSVKKPFYEAAQKKFLKRPDEVWVCGDRVETDLYPAYELGFHTVHMKWGRGKKAKREPWIEHTIASLIELKEKII